MQQKLRCPKCGAANDIARNVCQRCGLPLVSNTKPPSRIQPESSSRPRMPRTIGDKSTRTQKPDAVEPSKEGPYRGLALFFGICTVIGLIWTIYSHFASIEKRDLEYAINPIPSIVVSSQACHEISVAYRGNELGCVDISIAQITVWNKGKKSIEQSDFLQDGVYIQTIPAVEVLNAQVTRVSRKQTEFAVIYSADTWKVGRVPLNWRILEENDGAMIQLMYLGSPEVELNLVANIEGINKARGSDWKTWSTNTTKWSSQWIEP